MALFWPLPVFVLTLLRRQRVRQSSRHPQWREDVPRFVTTSKWPTWLYNARGRVPSAAKQLNMDAWTVYVSFKGTLIKIQPYKI